MNPPSNPINNATKYINDIYDKTTFSDNYGSSIMICIIVTIVVLSIFSYCLAMQKKQEIYADWNNNRCKPQYIPIAGFIAAPANQSISDYTTENFQYCLNSQATTTTGYLLQPISYMITSIFYIASNLWNSIDAMRGMFAKFRDNVSEFVKQVMGKLLNITTPIIVIISAFLDSLKKTQGVMATGLFTLLSVYYALQAAVGSILQLMGGMLAVMVIIIGILWVLPFTWIAAATSSAIYVIIALILMILITEFVIMFNIMPIKVPKLKCFDKNVRIKLDNGITKDIMDINVGDILENGVRITGKMKLDAANLRMFNIRDIIISETHIVKYGNKWIPVRDHPEAIEIYDYAEPYLYCLNTNSKVIVLNGLIFTDWDEIYDDTLEQVLDAIPTNIFEKDHNRKCINIHRYLDVGFGEDTIIDLIGNTNKKIKDVNVNDILLSGAKVYGIVEIEASELLHICQSSPPTQSVGLTGKENSYHKLFQSQRDIIKFEGVKTDLSLGNNSFGKLYHLLTNDKVFSSGNQIIPDYNDHIDKLLNI